jgi:hypothetical protein
MSKQELRMASRPVNPTTQRSFRREVGWQIYVPLAVGVVVLVTLVVVVSSAGVADASLWADLAVVLMAVPACLLGIILFAALVAAGLGLARLTALLPPYSYQVQRTLSRLRAGIVRAADVTVAPFVATRSAGASAQAGMQVVGRLFRRKAGGDDV